MTISDTRMRMRLIKDDPVDLIYEGSLPNSHVADKFRHARDCVKGNHFVITGNTEEFDPSRFSKGMKFRALVTHGHYVVRILAIEPLISTPSPS